MRVLNKTESSNFYSNCPKVHSIAYAKKKKKVSGPYIAQESQYVTLFMHQRVHLIFISENIRNKLNYHKGNILPLDFDRTRTQNINKQTNNIHIICLYIQTKNIYCLFVYI